MSGSERGRLIMKLADLIDKNADELAYLECIDNGKPLVLAKHVDIKGASNFLRYYSGYADKIHGSTIPINGPYMCYTRKEPVGVVGTITPWNFPILLMS
jgi:aldehyde dehydrogenase (NAD+)